MLEPLLRSYDGSHHGHIGRIFRIRFCWVKRSTRAQGSAKPYQNKRPQLHNHTATIPHTPERPESQDQRPYDENKAQRPKYQTAHSNQPTNCAEQSRYVDIIVIIWAHVDGMIAPKAYVQIESDKDEQLVEMMEIAGEKAADRCDQTWRRTRRREMKWRW